MLKTWSILTKFWPFCQFQPLSPKNGCRSLFLSLTSLNFDSLQGTNHTVSCWFPGCLQTPEGTYKFTRVRPFVRPSVRPCVRSGPTALTVRYFFLIFCMKLGLHTTSIDTKKFFGRKKNFDPQMAKNGQNLAIFWPQGRSPTALLEGQFEHFPHEFLTSFSTKSQQKKKA